VTQKPDGGPAYPPTHDPKNHPSGMTLRDYFAGQADTSGYEFPDHNEAAKALNIEPPFNDSLLEAIRFSMRIAAALKYMNADAMIAARETGE